jgi:peptide/nickel transport system permease protein
MALSQYSIADNVRKFVTKKRTTSTSLSLYWGLKLLSLGSITLMVFALPHLVPGSPIRLYESWPLTSQQREQLIAEYGFDRSLPSQYIFWLQRIVTGRWGSSRYYQRSILQDVWQAAGLTLLLLFWTALASLLWGMLWGRLRRVWSPTPPRRLPRLLLLVTAVPNFLIAILLRDVLIWQLGWISMANLPLFDPHYLFNPLQMLLPASALALTPLLVCSASRTILSLSAPSSPHAPSWRQRRMQFCTLFCPLLDVFLLDVLLTEYVFSLPGLGSLGIAALKRRDFPMFQGFLLCAALLYVLLHLVLDWGRRARSQELGSTSNASTSLAMLSPSRWDIYSGICCLVTLLALALWAPLLTPHDPATIHSNDQLLLPGYRYILGTDFLGRDVFSRTVEGFRSLIPRVMLVTVLTSGAGWLLWLLGRLLPRPLKKVSKGGLELLTAMPPFLLAFMIFLIVEQYDWALELTLLFACLPLAGQLLASPVPLLYRAASLARLGSLILLLTVTFFFLNITTESFVPTWGGDIRLGMNYSHINIWILLTPSLAIAWSRYSFHLLSDHLSPSSPMV